MDEEKKKGILGTAINLIHREAIHFLGRVYRAGTSLEEGIENIEKAYYDYHRYCALDIFGESAKSKTQAQDYFDCYQRAIPAIAELAEERKKRKADDKLSELFGYNALSSISLKASAICHIEYPGSEEAVDEVVSRLEELLEPAQKEGIGITIDAEDHEWSDLELNVAKKLWDKGYYNLGMVLQSRLNRTKDDVDKIKEYVKDYEEEDKRKIRIRACIGAYPDEPEELIASKDKEVKNRLVKTIIKLFEAGVYVEIATHDHEVINRVVDYIEKKKFKNDRFEFQFLRGVESGKSIEPILKAKGYKVREYMPIELKRYASVPYIDRRIKEDPELKDKYVRNLVKKCLKSRKRYSKLQYQYN